MATANTVVTERHIKLLQMEAVELVEDLYNFEKMLLEIIDTKNFAKVNILKISLSEVCTSKEKYCKIYRELVCDDNVPPNLVTGQEFKTKLIELKDLLNTFQGDCKSEALQSIEEYSLTNKIVNQFNHHALPPLALPKFKGDFTEFRSFEDSFNSILSTITLSDVQKFSYLKSSLSGEALNAIFGLQMTNQNYSVAWQILKDRYDKPKLIIQQHIKNIFEIKAVTQKSAKYLKDFLDTLNKNLLSLQNLHVTDEQLAGAFLSFIVTNKIDNDSKEKFKKFRHNETLTIAEVVNFLQERVKFLIEIDIDNVVDGKLLSRNKSFPKQENTALLVTTDISRKQFVCVLCKGDHTIQHCENFRSLSPELRLQKIQSLHLCRNCLLHDENKMCRSSFKCRTCQKRHHSLLHIQKTPVGSKGNNVNDDKVASTSNKNEEIVVAEIHPEPILACQTFSQNKNITLLSTVKVFVKDFQGHLHVVKGILDNGAQQNLVSKRLASKLNLPRHQVSLQIAGLHSDPINITESMHLQLRSLQNNYQLNLNCLIVSDVIAKIPVVPFDVSNLKIPDHVKLADDEFNVPENIDILIGAAHFYRLLVSKQISLGNALPVLQKTKFGYIVTGCIQPLDKTKSNNISVVNLCLSDNQLHDSVTNFFKLDEVQPIHFKSLLSKEEQECEQHFDSNVTRDHTGRFTVAIPFNEKLNNLGNSFATALRRFTSLEKRLSKNSELKKLYSDFMAEYVHLQHMSLLPSSNKNLVKYFLPHFEVFREQALTTKLRVVFDGSSTTDNGLSLNDCQKLGPVVQDSLFSILLRFRGFQVALVADCEKMYRQILVNAKQRCYQCILWRPEPQLEIKVYELNTITYGLKSSSYLATKCLQRLAFENIFLYSNAAEQLLSQMYIDDFLGGAESVTDAIRLRNEITSILAHANVPLRKFLSNNSTVLPNSSKNTTDCFTVPVQEGESAKALGIKWNPTKDILHFSFDLDVPKVKITKRGFLSLISKLFDPLGLISPLIVRGKILVQQLWREQLSWDSEIPREFQNKFLSFLQELRQIHEFSIPRIVILLNPLNVQLHGFADASTVAFGACIYIRSVNLQGVRVTLLCSKSKVAPLKQTITIPKLELCANVLLAQLYSNVSQSINFKVDQSFLWSDSQIALGWIKSIPNKFKVFVANRIAAIQELTQKDMWNHVSTQQNPADLISRGSTVSALNSNSLWCKGPQFLWEPEITWPLQNTAINVQLPEIKASINLLTTDSENDTLENLINNISTYFKLLRILTYVNRFITNIKANSENRNFNHLTVFETNESLNQLVRYVQSSCFKSEIHKLKSKSPTKMNSTLFSTLHIFLDPHGIVRVGGRISESLLHYDIKHPILLPKDHRFTYLLLEHYHKKFLHCGPNQLLAVVRSKFWVLAGRNACKKVVKKCLKCFRYSPMPCKTKMGNLPPQRLAAYKSCFEYTGCDFTGHFLMKSGYTRKASFIKSYVCLFICTVTKAIHLELVTSLTSSAFIEAFKRFVARRGKPSHVYSDNGSNFVSSASTMKEFYLQFRSQNFKNSIQAYSLSESIQWHFIPPRSPHFGGLWESNIRRVKAHIYKVLKDVKLNYECFSTLLCQIESVLNSRPLAPLANDPSDPQPLTPFHFLIGKEAQAIPEPSLLEVPENRLNQYQLRTKLIEHFWKRWYKEVLSEYQRASTASRNSSPNLKVGDLVLVVDEQVPKLQWPLGRIASVHPGPDEIVRVVTIKMASGKLTKRAAKKVCPLPTNY